MVCLLDAAVHVSLLVFVLQFSLRLCTCFFGKLQKLDIPGHKDHVSSSKRLQRRLPEPCYAAFNSRYAEVVTPIAHLALLLHPLYRFAMGFSKKDYAFYQQLAGNFLKQFRKRSPEAIQNLANQLREFINFQ